MAFALPFITALMLVQPVSATEVIYDDALGDTPVWSWGRDGTPFTNLLNSNPPMVQVGYFDMTKYSLSLVDEDHYRFWMEVLVDLPEAGDAFPPGIVAGEWLMYIDPGPYNPVYNPVVSLFVIGLRYDGSQYSAFLYDYGTGERTSLESFEQSTLDLWVEFPTSVVGGLDLYGLWWSAGTKAYFCTEGVMGWRIVDITDYDEDLATYDIPWPV